MSSNADKSQSLARAHTTRAASRARTPYEDKGWGSHSKCMFIGLRICQHVGIMTQPVGHASKSSLAAGLYRSVMKRFSEAEELKIEISPNSTLAWTTRPPERSGICSRTVTTKFRSRTVQSTWEWAPSWPEPGRTPSSAKGPRSKRREPGRSAYDDELTGERKRL